MLNVQCTQITVGYKATISVGKAKRKLGLKERGKKRGEGKVEKTTWDVPGGTNVGTLECVIQKKRGTEEGAKGRGQK